MVKFSILRIYAVIQFRKFFNFPLIEIILRFKKVYLSLLDSLREARLIQGNTVSLIRNDKSRDDNRDILFNYKIPYDSGPIKSIGRYKSGDNFITCLQNVPSSSDSARYFLNYKLSVLNF